jgi:uncharacterized membrane protein YeaQ/YmgE (transglycosylase-associated protein family)
VLILAIIVLGMGAGALAQLIVPTHQRVNWTEALVVGLIGSFVGGLLISLLFGDGLRLRPSGIIGSIVGAIIVQLIWRAIRSRQAPPASAQRSTGRTTPKKR